jgi:hypothetical protein
MRTCESHLCVRAGGAGGAAHYGIVQVSSRTTEAFGQQGQGVLIAAPNGASISFEEPANSLDRAVVSRVI